MKIIKDKVAKLSFVALLITVTAAMFYTPTASAHGEKSQAAFMRMRTIHWFDLNWSKEEVPVNDTMTISGKAFYGITVGLSFFPLARNSGVPSNLLANLSSTLSLPLLLANSAGDLVLIVWISLSLAPFACLFYLPNIPGDHFRLALEALPP
jgi:hypothetical protein